MDPTKKGENEVEDANEHTEEAGTSDETTSDEAATEEQPITYERLAGLIQQEIDLLAKKARVLLDEFWEAHLKANKRRKVGDRSQLCARMRTHGGGLYIEWYWNRWAPGKEGKGRKPLSTSIPRGKGYRYTESALKRHVQGWEWEFIWWYECQFAILRQMAHYYAQARLSVTRARKQEPLLEEIPLTFAENL